MSKLDVLNRKEFVDRMVSLTEQLSYRKAATTFAIDGQWGVGKSFVLDMFEDELLKIQSSDGANNKYFVIRYNCWKFDYYEEPLIAIVSNIIEEIERQQSIFPNEEIKSKIIGILKAVGVSLLSLAGGFIKKKTGIDFEKAYNIVKSGAQKGAKINEQKHSYDVYFGFNKAIKTLQNTLKEISATHTIVFCVDELDRCLPEYAIKVLERMHHLTEEITSIINIIAIDREQIEASIRQLFGFDVPKYLRKFIQFTLTLDAGLVSEKLVDKFFDYLSLFDPIEMEYNDSIEEFLQGIFQGIDARTQNSIIEKAYTLHKLLFSNCPEKKDHSFMCIELMMTLTTTCYEGARIVSKWLQPYIRVSDVSKPEVNFNSFLTRKLETLTATTTVLHAYSSQIDDLLIEDKKSLYAQIIIGWQELFFKNYKRINLIHADEEIQKRIVNNVEALKTFLEMLKLIK